jgi:uncharacterized protein (DUF305 family)
MKKVWIAAIALAIALAGGIAYAAMNDDEHFGGSRRGEMMRHMAQMHGGGMHGGGMHGESHGGMRHGGQAASSRKGDQSPSTLAFRGVNAKMHEGMEIEFSGNADVDFVKGMIPHHEGAVDMAKIVLAFGKDPEVKKLAEAIIKAQEDEIAWMKGWIEKNKK